MNRVFKISSGCEVVSARQRYQYLTHQDLLLWTYHAHIHAEQIDEKNVALSCPSYGPGTDLQSRLSPGRRRQRGHGSVETSSTARGCRILLLRWALRASHYVA